MFLTNAHTSSVGLRSGCFGASEGQSGHVQQAEHLVLNALNRGFHSLIKEYNSCLHNRSLKGMPRSESQSIIALFLGEGVGAGFGYALW
jgi:hypothetical protein